MQKMRMVFLKMCQINVFWTAAVKVASCILILGATNSCNSKDCCTHTRAIAIMRIVENFMRPDKRWHIALFISKHICVQVYTLPFRPLISNTVQKPALGGNANANKTRWWSIDAISVPIWYQVYLLTEDFGLFKGRKSINLLVDGLSTSKKSICPGFAK